MLLFLFSPQSVAYTIIFERHIIFISIPLALLAAWIISRMPKKISMVLLIVLLASLIPYDADILGNEAKWDPDYNVQSAGEFINQNYQVGDIVIVAFGFSRTDLTHYLNEQIPVYELYPVNYFGYDSWNTRHTLGLIENEYQSRVSVPSALEISEKLNALNKLYHPKRIWLFGFMQKDSAVYNWFEPVKWRQVYRNIADIFRVDLYSQN
jgi:hypothetical protein